MSENKGNDMTRKWALPNDVPEIPSSFGPKSMNNSVTVAALISQNEDLMARLTVSLRRSSEIEIRLQNALESVKHLTSQNDAFIDEVTLLREKNKQLEKICIAIKRDRTNLEIDIASLRANFTDLQNNNSSLSRQLEIKVKAAKRYQKFIVSRVYPKLSSLEQQNRELLEKCFNLTNQEKKMQSEIHEFKTKLNQAVDFIQSQSVNFQSDVVRLSSSYEEQAKSMKTQIETLTRAQSSLQGKELQSSQMLAIAQEREVQLENRALLSERRRDEMNQKYLEAIQELEIEKKHNRLSHLNLEMKIDEITKSNSTFQVSLAEASAKIKNLEIEQSAYKEQLQINANVIDNLSIRESSLMVVNRELNDQINKLKNDLDFFQTESALKDSKSREKVRLLESRIGSTIIDESSAGDSEKDDSVPRRGRIEQLIHKLESGFLKD